VVAFSYAKLSLLEFDSPGLLFFVPNYRKLLASISYDTPRSSESTDVYIKEVSDLLLGALVGDEFVELIPIDAILLRCNPCCPHSL
jgi:hypothetical protein